MENPLTYAGSEIPDLPEPIVAYRAWGIEWPAEWKPRLVGFSGTSWPTAGPLKAECMLGKDNAVSFGGATVARVTINGVSSLLNAEPCDEAPSPPATTTFGGPATGHVGYGCGIYAYKTPDQMLRHCARSGRHVWGRVLLWGKVFDHKGGYRAEYGQVHSFIPMFEPVWDQFSDPENRLYFHSLRTDALGIPSSMINRSPLRLRMLSAITGVPLVKLEEDPYKLLESIQRERAIEKAEREIQRRKLEALKASKRTIDVDPNPHGTDALKRLLEKLTAVSITFKNDDKKDKGEDDGRNRKPGS